MNAGSLLRLCSVVALSGVALIALDALLRRSGVYDHSQTAWPAAWRVRRVDATAHGQPYRATDRAVWEPAVSAGMPRGVTVFYVPSLLLTLLWSFAVVLAVFDVPSAYAGSRGWGHVLGSLLLCVSRSVLGLTVLGAVLERHTRTFALASAAVIALDAALATLPLPCSDIRTDDVRLAVVGLSVHAPMALGFAINHWRRRGAKTSLNHDPPVFH